MTMISYAQNAEDVLLNRAFAGRGDGFWIDVGASDPVVNSVTKHFADLGWRGVNVEPEQGTPTFERLRRLRPRDVNLNVGVADGPGTLAFYEVPAASGWSTFSAAQAAEMRRWGWTVVERTVPVTTLAAICEQHVPPGADIDFLKIDAEGFERAVLSGADWSRWRPRVVLVEDNGAADWEPILLGVDYRFAAFDGINRYYVRAEDAAALLPRLSAPVNVLDDYIPDRFLRLRYVAAVRGGQAASRVAGRLRRAAARHPRLAGLARRLVRRDRPAA